MDHPLSADAEEVIFPCRASKQLRDEMEEAWELLRYVSIFCLSLLYSNFSALTGSPSNQHLKQGLLPMVFEHSLN